MPKKPIQACLACQEKHIRCDEGQPKCTRCEKKNLECQRLKGSFRIGSSANYDAQFAADQQWVGTSSKRLHFDVPVENVKKRKSGSSRTDADPLERLSISNAPQNGASVKTGGGDPGSGMFPINADLASPATPVSVFDNDIDTLGTPSFPSKVFISQNVTEVCLLRYFVEELAPWFDTNDERRLFQLLVPKRALCCIPLLHAIYALSARRLVRDPRCQTSRGIVYQHKLLHNLDASAAVEHMLNCIPFLFNFQKAEGDEYRENIIAAAVILRQYEEIEEELDAAIDTTSVAHDHRPSDSVVQTQHANFLAVTRGIIDDCASFPTFGNETLANAAFWIAVRQEVYECFINERAPSMRFSPYHLGPVSPANRLVMHAAEVTRWNWGDKTHEEWSRLTEENDRLAKQYEEELRPIWESGANTDIEDLCLEVWFTSDAQVVSAQHFELARMVLIAEKPDTCTLHRNLSRAAQRKAEAEVRSIILRLCGIAFGNPKCLPALVSATMGAYLYREYFTDKRQRHILLSLMDEVEETHAWPVKRKRIEMLEGWKIIDDL